MWTYEKTYPVVPDESAYTVRGSGVLPVAGTPYGRLTTAICYDLEYPGLPVVRETGPAPEVPPSGIARLLPTAGESGEGLWHLHFTDGAHGPYPSRQAAWDD